MTDKIAMDVETLLRWAYQDELPKKVTSSAEGIWDKIADYGQRGGIDVGHGTAQRYSHFGLPHPDAEAIEKAVNALPDYQIDWGAQGEAIIGPLAHTLNFSGNAQPAPLVRKTGSYQTEQGLQLVEWMEPETDRRRDVIMVRSRPTDALISAHARMATRPAWCDVQPVPVPTPARHGPGHAIVGKCIRKGVYTEGTYCPLRWEPSPLHIANVRADYVAWHWGLRRLAETLELMTRIVLPPAAPQYPWHRNDHEPPRTIFRSREFVSRRPLPLKPARPLAGPPASKWKPREEAGAA